MDDKFGFVARSFMLNERMVENETTEDIVVKLFYGIQEKNIFVLFGPSKVQAVGGPMEGKKIWT